VQKTSLRKDYTFELKKSTDNGNTWTSVGSSVHECKEKVSVTHKYTDSISTPNTTTDIIYKIEATLLDDHWLAGQVYFQNCPLTIIHSPLNTAVASTPWIVDSTDRRYVTASEEVMKYYQAYQVDIPASNLPEIKYPFTIENGDELRFNGSEVYTYTVTNFENRSNGTGTDSVLTLDRPVATDVTSSFFLLRRYVDDPSNLIVDIPTLKDGISPGVIQTQYPSKDIKDNIDTIVAKLKSENSI
jgi:hypothetical protein